MRKTLAVVSPLVFFVSLFWAAAQSQSYTYIRIGQKSDAKTIPAFGIAMMGGGTDLDEAFRWLCHKGNSGDFLILRALGDDDYNAYVNGLCKTNSVATLVIPDRTAAQDPAVVEIIRHAEAIFIAGGNQARYVNFWKGTAVQEALNAGIAEGKPIGGTSAGLAVLGEFSYGALADTPDGPDLASTDVLPDPYFHQVTLVRDFLKIPLLHNVITDSHFAKRDRMGRSLGFLARIMQDGWDKHPREIAIDEKSAVLVEGDGNAMIVGSGKGAYFMRPSTHPMICKPKTPLTFRKVSVYKAPAGAHFNLHSWTGRGGVNYELSVDEGNIQSTQAGASIY
ncbi:MAG: cyanophycinase [Candidatus Sulfotelmatobacter sp.]